MAARWHTVDNVVTDQLNSLKTAGRFSIASRQVVVAPGKGPGDAEWAHGDADCFLVRDAMEHYTGFRSKSRRDCDDILANIVSKGIS